jgi:ribosomal protein L16 Arg81 hydroxylase
MSNGPSKRHFQYDYTDPETVFTNDISSRHTENARALETVLKEGEILYVPSYWMHYIISLHGEDQEDPAINYQCNTRSGTSPMAYEDKLSINECLGENQEAPTERWWETAQNWKPEEEQQGLRDLSKQAERVREDLKQPFLGGAA